MDVNVRAEELEKENMGRGEQFSFLRLSFIFSKKKLESLSSQIYLSASTPYLHFVSLNQRFLNLGTTDI